VSVDKPLRLCDFLRKEREAIVSDWEHAARQSAGARELPSQILRNSIPRLLEEIADLAESAARCRMNNETQAEVPKSPPKSHALQRLDLDFSLEEMTREYALLRRVILGKLSPRVGELAEDELVFLNEVLDQAIVEAVAAYSEGVSHELDEERALLSVVIEQMPAAVLIADARSGKTIRANREVEQIMGRRAPVAENFDSYAYYKGFTPAGRPYAPDDWPIVRAIKSGEHVTWEEIEIEQADGSRIVALVSAGPLRDAEGKVTAAAAAAVDITERKRIERALAQAEVRYRRILESGIVGVLEYSPDGTVSAANDCFLAMTGYSREEIREGRLDIFGLTPPEYHGATSRAQESLLRRGMMHPHEKQYFRKDGSRIDVLVSAATLDEQNRRGVVLVVDISERKRLELEQARRTEFEQQLIGIVSHDLRSPLSAISLAASILLRRRDLDPRSKGVITSIVDSAERANRMILDLLDFSRARLSGGIPVHRTPGDVHELVAQVVDELRVSHPERAIVLEVQASGEGEWDADRLAQIVTNLVTNALNHGAPDSPVVVRVGGDAQEVDLVVENRGPPIPAWLLPRLFKPFRRGPSASSSAAGSLGLGLYIVKHLVDAHRGSVDVDSSLEEGTVFTVRLPRQLAGGD
jgi:PAS domain S-box-containing protein